MRRLVPRSLAGRLVLALALVQSAVILGGMVLWMLTSPYVTWADVAGETTAGLVIESLSAGPDGRPRIQPVDALLDYRAARADLAYAVLLDGDVLPGATPALAEALRRLGPSLPREGRLAVPMEAGSLAMFRAAETEFGPVVVATAGNRFRPADDIGTFFAVYVVQLIPMFGPALLAAFVAIPLVIRRMLRPLRNTARDAAAINLVSLERRLDGSRAPTEMQPFIAAINGLLARIEEGVRQQRVFTANAAHELRTPVAILQARLESLPEATRDRAALMRDVRRITLLLDQLLSVARLGQRDAALDETVDLAAAARAVVADMAPLAIRAGRQLAVEGEVGPLPVRGNARAIESALANLVENALRAEPEGGTVIVTLHEDGRLTVTDHGSGVASQDRPFLFEPFWRKDERTRGTGLGLAIVQEVARLHGGLASVEETAGGGATFVIALPVPAASDQALS